MIDDELRAGIEIAKKVPRGPWEFDLEEYDLWCDDHIVARSMVPDVANHFIANDPQTAIALREELLAARARIAKLEDVINAVLGEYLKPRIKFKSRTMKTLSEAIKP